MKDKLFFFYSFDGRRQLSQSSVVRTVPLASMGQGILRYCESVGRDHDLDHSTVEYSLSGSRHESGRHIAPWRRPRRNIQPMTLLPVIAPAAAVLNTAGYRFNAPTPVSLTQHWAKFDLNITNNQQLSVRTVVQYDKTSLTPAFPDTPRPGVWSHPWGIAVGHTWTINAATGQHCALWLHSGGFYPAG